METMTSTNLLSLVALLIALSSLVVNYLLLRLRRDPEVVVSAVPDPRRPTIINLIIENTGGSVAHDVQFESDRPIPSRAYGFNDAPDPDAMTDGPLIKGIASFGPGEKRVITWGQYGGLKRGVGDSVLTITAIYKSRPPLRIMRQRHKTISSIDVRSLEGTDISDHNWDKKTAEYLGKISQLLDISTDRKNRSIRILSTASDDDEK